MKRYWHILHNPYDGGVGHYVTATTEREARRIARRESMLSGYRPTVVICEEIDLADMPEDHGRWSTGHLPQTHTVAQTPLQDGVPCSRCNRLSREAWASDWTEANEADPNLPPYTGCTTLCTACLAGWYGRQPR